MGKKTDLNEKEINTIVRNMVKHKIKDSLIKQELITDSERSSTGKEKYLTML